MSGFPADWLTLREPFDAVARDPALADSLATWCAGRAPLRLVDLGSGTGSTLRWLAPRLPVNQKWLLAEYDPALVAAGSALLAGHGGWRYVEADLATSLEDVLGEPCDVITASALLDLVSADWIRRLARLAGSRRAALYLTLTYDGQIRHEPEDPLDAVVRGWVNEHQTIDKGFGPALGPAASATMTRALELLGGRLATSASPWQLGPRNPAIQRELIRGWASAARAVAPGEARRIEGWCSRRLDHVVRGSAACSVGHVDLLWLPD